MSYIRAKFLYNLRSLPELQKLAPTFPWVAFLKSQRIQDRKEYNVAQVDVLPKLGQLFTDTPVRIGQTAT